MREWTQIRVRSRAELRKWLADNHEQADPIWLVTAKKAVGAAYIPYPEIVEEALCFGWVDSLPRALDATSSMLLLSPRKARSAWSAPNRERAERLITASLMQPSGLAKVEAAKADGSWDFLKSAEDGIEPDDLRNALDANAAARKGYDAFSGPVRRRILETLLRAKGADTRAARIARIVDGAIAGADPLIWKPKG
jgi:uncharacterized protein YdeI (YjbR/CyaY-like superfamily)